MGTLCEEARGDTLTSQRPYDCSVSPSQKTSCIRPTCESDVRKPTAAPHVGRRRALPEREPGLLPAPLPEQEVDREEPADDTRDVECEVDPRSRPLSRMGGVSGAEVCGARGGSPVRNGDGVDGLDTFPG